MFVVYFFFFKQKTAYEMRISDWSSDVCSSDLIDAQAEVEHGVLINRVQSRHWRTQRQQRLGNVRTQLQYAAAGDLVLADLAVAHDQAWHGLGKLGKLGAALCADRKSTRLNSSH